jgi:hypothetical protein
VSLRDLSQHINELRADQENFSLLEKGFRLELTLKYNSETMQTIYEAAGGSDGLLRLASAWHTSRKPGEAKRCRTKNEHCW